MGLKDRIDRRQDNPNIVPLIERRVPEWVKRAQHSRLPNSDRTGTVAA